MQHRIYFASRDFAFTLSQVTSRTGRPVMTMTRGLEVMMICAAFAFVSAVVFGAL
jgi:hypothetical protein